MERAVLITGGAGAIGSNLCAALLSRGFKVVVLDDLSSGTRENVPAGALFLEGNLTDSSSLEAAFRYNPDFVFHLAALFANQNSVDHPQKDLEVNGLGTLRLLEKSKAHNVKKFVFFSSSCVYGPVENLSEATRDFLPETPYAITKLLGEQYCRFFADAYDFPSVILRVFNTYGPGENPGRYRNVIPNFISRAALGEPLPIYGTGEETRSFTFVEDTVQGALLALFTETKPAEVFNISNAVETPIIELANKINEMTGNKAGVQFLPRRSWDHVLKRKADVKKAKERLGFEAKTPLDEGLVLTYEWLKKNGKVDSTYLLRVPPASGARGLLSGENDGRTRPV